MSFRRAALLSLVIPSLALAQGQGAAPAAAPADPAVWAFDRAHSEVAFNVRHFMSRVRGNFRQWTGTIRVADPAKWEAAEVDVTIQTASIFTDNENRDRDLRSDNFFLADSFPTITFKSTKIERSGTDAKVHGNLTMRGVTKPIVLDGKFLGSQGQGQGQQVGFELTGTVNRKDYGIKYARMVEGAAVVGDDVKIEIMLRIVRPRPPRPAGSR